MKSRDQIEREALAAKQEEQYNKFLGVYGSLSKELETIKSFLSSLKDINIKHEHEYRLTDEILLKELKTTLESIDIPKEILLKKKIHHTTEKKSIRFLWWYFVISTTIIGGALYFAYHQHKELQSIKNETKTYEQGLEEGYQTVYKVLPKASQEYLKEKYPKAFK